MIKILIFIGFTLSSCNHSNIAQKDRVENYFTTRISTIDKFLSTGKSEGSELDEAIVFLEELTNIESNINEGYDDVKLPNKYNVEDWKAWYKLNKSNLYWDTKKNKILIHGNAKYIVKDPNLEYQRFLSIIKKYVKSDNVDIDDLNYAVHFITDLTNIKDKSYSFLPDTELPQKEIIQKWENWFEQNQKSLYWDKKTHKVKMKKK